jgi:SET domain-containing protein
MKKKTARRAPLFEVRHSPIHGFGVFALRRIRKGTTVTEYIGDRISHAEADRRYESKTADDNHTFLFTVDGRTVIDGGVGGNDARYINHGCDPNCESATANRRVFIEAIRTIEPGDELAYDYQIQRDPDDPPNVDEVFACRCGAEKCRGSMLEPAKEPRAKKRKKTKTAARSGQHKTALKAARKAARKARGKAPRKNARQQPPKGRARRA